MRLYHECDYCKKEFEIPYDTRGIFVSVWAITCPHCKIAQNTGGYDAYNGLVFVGHIPMNLNQFVLWHSRPGVINFTFWNVTLKDKP